MNLSIIIVSYNSAPFLRNCLQSLLDALKKISFEIFVVDNASRDTSVAVVKIFYPRVHLIVNKRNIGFAAACNLVLPQLKGDYVLLLNPDVHVRKETISKMIHYMDKHLDIGVMSCKLLNPASSLQHSCRQFPTVLSLLLKRFFPSSKIVADYLLLHKDHNHIMEVDWLLGALLLIQRDVIEQIGLFDPRFFLYFEDVDFCLRAWKHGWKVVYFPEVVATHVHKQASRKLFSREQWYHFKSMISYYLKHGWKLS